MKNPIRLVPAFVPALVLAWCAAGAAQAAPTTLAALLGGGSITAGDKLFDNWKLVNYAASDPARTFNAANIEVDVLSDGGLDPGPGLSFSVLNRELTVSGDGIYAYVDLMFGFSVQALDPSLRIKDNTLAYNAGGAFWSATLDGSYDVGSYIRENLDTKGVLSDPALTGDLATTEIEFATMDDGSGQTSTSVISASANFLPQSKLWVTKNVFVWAADTTEAAGIQGFEQRFSQTAVPEPASWALVAIALAGAVAPRMRRRRLPAAA